MELIRKPLHDIKPYPNNPRNNERAVSAVMESIRQCGYIAPIIVDEDGIILAGHTRHKALERLGMADAETIVREGLTEEQKRKYRLLDNKTNELAEWDMDLLVEEIEGLDFGDLCLDWGIINDLEDVASVEEDGYAASASGEPKAKYGDVYRLGNHRLMCGDSTSIDDVERLMGGDKADMVFTDPPYGISYQSNARDMSEKFDIIKNDDKILDFFPSIRAVCDGFVMICTTWKVLSRWLPLFEEYYRLTNMIVWDKGGGGIGDLVHTFATDYEIILVANNGKEIKNGRIGSVWDVGKYCVADYVHPTQKPVGLAAMAISHTTNRRDTVLDLFGGSGSTLIACEEIGRDCCTMELDPKYVDVIIDRWEKLTGKKAELVN